MARSHSCRSPKQAWLPVGKALVLPCHVRVLCQLCRCLIKPTHVWLNIKVFDTTKQYTDLLRPESAPALQSMSLIQRQLFDDKHAMPGLDSEQGALNATKHASRRVLIAPDVRQHDLEELLGGEDPLTPAGRGAVQGACGCHHAVGAAQVSLAALTQTVCWQNHLMTAVFVHESLQA